MLLLRSSSKVTIFSALVADGLPKEDVEAASEPPRPMLLDAAEYIGLLSFSSNGLTSAPLRISSSSLEANTGSMFLKSKFSKSSALIAELIL